MATMPPMPILPDDEVSALEYADDVGVETLAEELGVSSTPPPQSLATLGALPPDVLARERRYRPSPAALYLASLGTEKSRRTGRESLRRVCVALGRPKHDAWVSYPWERLTIVETTYVRARLLETMGPATVRLTLTQLRGTLKCAWQAGYLDHETYTRACSLPPVRGTRLVVGRELTAGELARLRDHLAELPGALGVQQTAIFAVGIGGGLRREEIAHLRADALSLDATHLRVLGKGRRERIVRLLEGAGAVVAAWLAERRRLELASDEMFVNLTADGRCLDVPLLPEAMGKRVTRELAAAGIDAAPHDLRRTYATRLIRATGGDLATVARMLGHESISTTTRYDKRGDESADAAAKLLSLWG